MSSPSTFIEFRTLILPCAELPLQGKDGPSHTWDDTAAREGAPERGEGRAG